MAPFAYVTNETSSNVSVIDTATNNVEATIRVGSGLPGPVAVTPDGEHVYVGVRGQTTSDDNVSVIDAASNTVVAKVPLAVAAAIAITPDGKRAYVVAARSLPEPEPRGPGFVIDTASNTVVAHFEGDNIAIAPDGKAYVTHSGDGTVSVIATATNTVVGTPFRVGFDPTAIAITRDGKHLYVAIRPLIGVPPGPGERNISVIDTASKTVVATGPNFSPVGIAITPDGKHVYVTEDRGTPPNHRGFVSVIDTADNTVVAELDVPPSPGGIAITPDGRHAYVAIGGSPSGGFWRVFVINTGGNNVVATVPVGVNPVGVGIVPPP
jgi:YVTN family beta-propeller protein